MVNKSVVKAHTRMALHIDNGKIVANWMMRRREEKIIMKKQRE